MSSSAPLALLPVNVRSRERLQVLGNELLYAWDHTDARVAQQWGLSAAATFSTALKRRTTNLFKLAGWLGTAAVAETMIAIDAYRQDRLRPHMFDRATGAVAAGADLAARAKVATAQAAQLVRTHPRDAVPQLLVLVATSLVVSGGPDGDGGAPDLDLMFGIDAHRSVLSHSILMGAALEAGILSLVQLVQLLHAKLPPGHDPVWDRIASEADSLAQAASIGASAGMAFHLLVDGLLQPAAYRDLPMALPIEVHQAIFVANATAEAVDVANKPRRGGPGLLTQRLLSGQLAQGSRKQKQPKTAPEPLPAEPWWETASASELELARNEHRRRRADSMLVDPFVADMLADAELLIIERYGCWLEGLADGTLRPLTVKQARFVEAAERRRAPETPHEQAWVMYQGLLKYAPAAKPPLS
jgi:hypothetical protein